MAILKRNSRTFFYRQPFDRRFFLGILSKSFESTQLRMSVYDVSSGVRTSLLPFEGQSLHW